jgi:hypothetical protein
MRLFPIDTNAEIHDSLRSLRMGSGKAGKIWIFFYDVEKGKV